MHNSYTDLDTLFDTRLAVASLLDPDGTADAINTGSYQNRLKDNIGRISGSIINTIHDRRNKGILQFSLPTKMFGLIKEHISDVMFNLLNVETMSMKLYVNIYPYDLNFEEQENMSKLLGSKFPGIEILLVNMSHNELTPDWVHRNVKYMFKHDAMYWIEYHTSTKKIIERPLFTTLIIVPSILTSSVKSIDINKEYLENIRKSVETVADIEFIDGSYFSVDIDKKNK